jgi:group I intron endonuclease
MKKQDNVIIGIYKITSPSGKIYIGQSTNIENRFEGYKKLRCKSQPKLHNSLKKYGPENHKFEIIEECVENQLLERETHWKYHYNVLTTPSLCCRIDGKGGKDSEETRLKKSQAHMGNQYNLGRIQSEETRLKISSKIKDIKRTEEQIQNMSKPRINKEKFKISNKRKKIKPVLQYDLYGNFIKKWESISDAEKSLGVNNNTNISACCLGKQKTAWGFIWIFENGDIKKKIEGVKHTQVVVQYDLEGNFIKEWDNIKQIKETLGFSYSSIYECVNGKWKQGNGFIWKYKEI